MRIVEAFKDIERRGEGLGEGEAGRLCVRQRKTRFKSNERTIK